MPPLQMDGPRRMEFRKAILAAYPNPMSFPQLMADRLNRAFYEYAPPLLNYELQVNEVLTEANAKGWIGPLLAAVLEAAPGNARLQAFAAGYGFTALSADGHQRMVQAGATFLDPALFRQRLGIVEAQTCRVEIDLDQGKTSYGTGFLLGPSVVMTNYHVLEPVYARMNGTTTKRGYSAKPENVTVRFDYKEVPGDVLNKGVTYGLAAHPGWDLDRSESFSPVDADPPDDRLDYALIRLAEPAGSHKVGQKGAATGEDRSWLTPLSAYAFDPDTPLLILQHPKGSPLKLAFSSNGVIGLRPNRLRHRVLTEPGSSGSPCFHQELGLVALHHAGDPDFDRPAAWNQAIPFERILAHMKQRGTAAHLGT